MYEMIFLWALALVFIIFAVVQDIRTREIANWLSFSLIIFALGFRFFYSLFEADDFVFFYQGLIGLGIFFAIGNLLYYGKVFAGGDAKLMIALGTILPISPILSKNFQSFFDFLFIFLCVGFLYIIISSIVLLVKNFKAFKKEFAKQLNKNKKIMVGILFLSIALLGLGFIESIFFSFSVLAFITCYLYLYSKAIDEACMIKKIKTKNLREGDWLYSDLKIGKKMIKAKWEGLTKKDIIEIRKRYKEIKIRQGVAFSPVFLIAFVVFAAFIFLNFRLWNPFW